MSKLLKSKILLGVFVVAVMFAVGAVSVLAADGAITSTLRYGMSNIQVKYLQQTLNETGFTVAAAGRAGSAGMETSFFGNATKLAVKAYQTAMGLVSDGIFGPASRGALGNTVTGLPAGCSSTAGFSTTTGVACNSGTTTTTYPAGCSSTVGYSPTTGVKCDNTTTTTTTTNTTTNPTGPVTVALATDTPAARSVVTAEAGADLAHYTFSGTGTVTNVTLKRVGISADASFLNVYLYDGATRLTDAASVSSNSLVTFNDPNGLFTVSGSKTISVKVDMAGTAGETVGVSLIGYTALSQTAVSLATPSQGNLMTVAGASLAGVAFGSITPATNTGLTPASDIIVWQSTASVTTRDVLLSRFAIREVGSIGKADISNLRLVVDGVTVATVANPNANGYATFVPSSPLTLKTGSHVIKVVADVTGGSSLAFTFSIRNKTDIGLVDSQYNVGLLTSTAIGSLAGNTQTISTGYVTVQKATNSPTSTIVLAGTDVVLGRFTATTYGEKVKVDTVLVDFDTNITARLRNGRVLVDGAQVGSTTSILADGTTSFNINHTFTPGTAAVVEVRADVYDNDGTGAFAAGDTIKVSLIIGVNNAQGLVSGDATLDFPQATVAANTLTIGSGTITLAKDQAYGNQSVVVPTTGTLLGSFTLNSGTTEALNLDTIQVDLTVAGDFGAGDLSNVYVMYGAKSTSSKSTVSAVAGANTWNISESMAVNTSMTFKVYGDIATGAVVTAGGDTVITSLLVSGTSASGTAVNTNSNAVLAGQTISAVSTGTLTVSLDSNTPVAAQVVAGSTDAAGALKVKIVGTNEEQYVKSVKVYVDTNSNAAAVSSMNLAWSATSNGTYATVGSDQSVSYTVSTYPGYSVWNLTGTGRVTVPKNGSVYLKVTPSYVSSGQTEVSGKTPKLFLGDLQAEGTALLSASSATPNLVNDTGIIVQSGGSATFVSSTETDTAADTTAAATTLVTANGPTLFLPGDVIFVDENNNGAWNVATEELMVVLADAGANLTVQRGAFGTTAVAYAVDTRTIYRLRTATMTTNAGIVGNAMTVLETKLGLALKSDSPSGAFTGGTGKYLFGLTASAANNSADSATNTATITYFDITNNKSAATVANLKAYPAEYDNNSTYATTCVGLSATKWRCTLSTTGSTNEVDENASRSYTFRGDLGYSGAGSVDFSLASLGTSSDSANSVYWSDGAATPTAQYWVNQPTTVIQGGSLTTTAASGSADATAPTISSVAIANGSATLLVDAGDTITITFSEMIDPSIISATLIPGSSVTGVAQTATGGLACTAATPANTCTIKNIATFVDTYGTSSQAVATSTSTLALNSAGTVLTITLTAAAANTNVGAQTFTALTALVGTATAGIRDINGTVMAAGVLGFQATGGF